jgi:hypothetical protein
VWQHFSVPPSALDGYERGAMRALLAAGMPVRQVNPFKLRQFARASGVLAKNDPLDARMIASFVAIMPTRPAQHHRIGRKVTLEHRRRWYIDRPRCLLGRSKSACSFTPECSISRNAVPG